MATRKATAPKGSASTHSASRTTKSKTNFDTPAENFRLTQQEQILPPHVLKTDKGYFAGTDLAPVHLLSKALLISTRSEAEALAKYYSADSAYKHLGKITPERLVFTKRGLVIGTTTKPESYEYAWTWEADQIYTLALAEAAAFVDRDPDENDCELYLHECGLTRSPLWKALLSEYEAELQAEQADLAVGQRREAGTALGWLASRLFYAGICAGRTESRDASLRGERYLDTPSARRKRTAQ